MNREKGAFLISLVLIYQHVELFHCRYFGLNTALYKRCHYRFTDIPPPDLRVTFMWRSVITTLPAISSTAQNIRGEKFQCVGRTIFMKSKMLLFQIFKIFTFSLSFNHSKWSNSKEKNSFLLIVKADIL